MYIVSTNLIDCRIIEVAIGYRAITTIGVSSMVVGKVFVLFFFFENGFSFWFSFDLVWFRLRNNNNNDNKMVEFSHLNINWHIKFVNLTKLAKQQQQSV